MFSRGAKLDSFIGSNTHFKGDLSAKGALKIDGSIDGHVKADWIIVGEKGCIKGDVTANCITVGGYIEGGITAQGLVDIRATGRVRGDVQTDKFVIQDGGIVDGKVTMATICEIADKGLVCETAAATAKSDTARPEPMRSEAVKESTDDKLADNEHMVHRLAEQEPTVMNINLMEPHITFKHL